MKVINLNIFWIRLLKLGFLCLALFPVNYLSASDSNCPELLKILTDIPEARHTLTRLREFRDWPLDKPSFTQASLTRFALDSKLEELRDKLLEHHNITTSVDDLRGLLDKVHTLKPVTPTEDSKQTQPPTPTTFEIPEELQLRFVDHSKSGSFHRRHHPDYLSAKIPENISSQFQVASFQTNSAVQSSPAWGPDGTLAVGSEDKHVYHLRPQTSELSSSKTLEVSKKELSDKNGTLSKFKIANEEVIRQVESYQLEIDRYMSDGLNISKAIDETKARNSELQERRAKYQKDLDYISLELKSNKETFTKESDLKHDAFKKH
jgi:hypothetical protein